MPLSIRTDYTVHECRGLPKTKDMFATTNYGLLVVTFSLRTEKRHSSTENSHNVPVVTH